MKETAHDTWFKIPSEHDDYAVLLPTSFEVRRAAAATLNFAIESLGKEYDTTGALCSWLPFSGNDQAETREKYFCSEFVVTAFQRIGFMETLDAKRTTPNSLYTFLKSS